MTRLAPASRGDLPASPGDRNLPQLEEGIVVDPERQFTRDYNHRCFMFQHWLQGHSLFQLPSLLELAHRQGDRPGLSYCSNGMVEVVDRWEKGLAMHRPAADTIQSIAANDSLVMLKHVEQDPVLGPVVRKLLSRMVELSGDQMREDMIVGRATILIASPRRITSYHIDADTNFLFQIAGDKTFSVFDQTDRALVTDNELENYHGGDANGAVFKTERQSDARTYDFRAGLGIHIPSTAPHWARNGDSVSVALSLNYDLRSIQRSGRIYAINRRLRRLGIEPTPPGVSAWRDRMKLTTAKTTGVVRRLAGRASATSSPAGWRPSAA